MSVAQRMMMQGGGLPPIPPPDGVNYYGIAATTTAPFGARDGAGLVSLNGTWYLLGGWNATLPNEWSPTDVTTNEVWSSSDLVTWTKILAHDPVAPPSGPGARWLPRHTFGYAVKDGYLWVIGGDAVLGPVPSDVWRSADGTTWERVAATSPWAYLSILGVLNGSFHIMGGTTSPYQHWRSADGVTWEQLPDMPAGRSSVTQASVLASRIFISGGLDADGTTQTNSTWMYDDVDGWVEMSASAAWSEREWIATASFGNRLWVLTGKHGVANAGGLRYSTDGGVSWVEMDVYPYPPSHADSVFASDTTLVLAAGLASPGSVYRIQALPPDPSVTMASIAWTLWFDGTTYNPVTPVVFGKASAGNSASHQLVVSLVGGVPLQGEINGWPTIIMNGVDDVIRYTGAGEALDIISRTAYTICFTGKLTTASGNSATTYANAGIASESLAYFNIGMRTNGKLEAYHDGGSGTHADEDWSAGALVHYQIKYDGTNLKIRKGKGAWTSVAKSQIASAVLGPYAIGSRYNLTQFAGMEICEYAATNVALSDATLDLVADDMAAKWGVIV